MAELVVDDPIRDAAGLLAAGGRPRLGQHQPVGNRLIWVFVAPLAHHVGQMRDTGAQDERQPGGLQGDLVGLGDHPGIGDHGDIGQLVGGLEGVDHRQHRGGLGLVALERLNRQREPGRVGQQAEGDLWLQTPLFGESGLTEPVTGIGLEVQRRDVEQHQARWPQSRMRCADRSQRLAPAGFGITRQAPLDRGIRRAGSRPTSVSTRSASILLVGSMIRASTRSRNTLSLLAADSNPRARYATHKVSHRGVICEDRIGNVPGSR